jgi:hypothetical protein
MTLRSFEPGTTLICHEILAYSLNSSILIRIFEVLGQ